MAAIVLMSGAGPLVNDILSGGVSVLLFENLEKEVRREVFKFKYDETVVGHGALPE